MNIMRTTKQTPSDVLNDLVRLVTRAFYDDEACVIMEALLRTPISTEANLAEVYYTYEYVVIIGTTFASEAGEEEAGGAQGPEDDS